MKNLKTRRLIGVLPILGLLLIIGAGQAFAQSLTALAAPALTVPQGTISTDLPTYQWTPVQGAVQYNIAVYWNAGLKYVVNTKVKAADVCTSSVCTYQPQVRLRNGSHKFKVRSIDANGAAGAYSAWKSFSVAVKLGVPVLVAPSGTITSSQPAYTWQAVTQATRYTLSVYSSTLKRTILTSTLNASSVCSSNGTCAYVQPTALKEGSNSFKVRAGSTYVWGTYSASKSFIYKKSQAASYVLLGWNDLGMHCYNRDFSDLAVLPPYNNLVAQVIQRGDPPKIITQNVRVEYSFPDNTYSVGKSNFWTYAQQLFNLPGPLPPNIGLTGKGLSGTLDAAGDHFTAQGIPLTEYNDNNWNTRYPFQKAQLVAKAADTGAVLASLTVVAPVSTEMRCDRCHADGQQENIATGKVETNILTLHDLKNKDKYPAPYAGKTLMDSRPVLCADCHASNALGLAGKPGIPNLSNAMHGQHKDKVPNTLDGCYSCHPGPQTKCLRDVMSQDAGMTCTSCHGTLAQVATNPNPWLNEPRCDSCHDGVSQNHALYRQSTGHGGVFCEACHDSTHAVAPSTQPNDAIKFNQLQGHNGPLNKCTVCHLTQPSGSIHGGN